MKTSCLFFCLIFAGMTSGCYTAQAPFGKFNSDLRKNEDYTFAIYNNQNRLMNFPLKAFEARLKALEHETLVNDLCKDLDSTRINLASIRKYNLIKLCNHMTEPTNPNDPKTEPPTKITDIYVVAHGWNYTIDESITNYQKYIDLINTISPSENFHPYFIFIAWPSAARPLTNFTRAIFPFGVDNEVSRYTSFIDHTLLFFPTVWKQTFNTYDNALGNILSEYHRKASFRDIWRKQEDAFEDNGRDVPVALILYGLLQLNKTDPENSDKPRESFKIHLVGHSFGAKLLTHAVLQAIEWSVQDTFSVTSSVGPGKVESKDEEKDNSDFDWDNFWKEKFREEFPVESLLLFNPAMNFSEVSTPFQFFRGPDQANFLQFIARKGIVFSNYDYPNGTFFDIAQIPFNASISQELNAVVGRIGENVDSMDWFENETPKNIGTFKNDSHAHLTVKFNERTSSSAVIALLKNITYKNTNSNPTVGTRAIRQTLVDGTGTNIYDHTSKVLVKGTNPPTDKTLESDFDLIYEDIFKAQSINEWVNLHESNIDEDSIEAGTLTVSFEEGYVNGEDVLGIRNQGIGFKQIGWHEEEENERKTKSLTYVERQYLNGKKFFNWPLKIAVAFEYIALIPALSASVWGITKPFNIYSNFKYHLKQNKTFHPTDGWREYLRQGFNGLHFFLPLDRFYQAFKKDGGVPEDQWGIWRSNISALGRTGLANADKGNISSPDFPIFDEQSRNDEERDKERLESEISAEELCNLSLKMGTIFSKKVISPHLIYSIDASKILNDKLPPVGAHDDIKSDEIAACPKKAKLSKRVFMLNFIYNFTNGGDETKVKRLTK